MADSLDDFFAKKDKKRGKDRGKTAALSAGALVKELEEGAKQVEFPVRKDNKTSTAIELLGLDADDADWKDFEDVEKRDYTGLKLKEMSLQDQNEDVEQTEQQVSETPAWTATTEPAATTAPATNTDTTKPYSTTTAATISTTASSNTTSTTAAPPATTTTTTTTTTTNNDTSDAKPAEETTSKDEPSGEDKGDKSSAKSRYVPPQARGEFKVLEPVRLSKLKQVGSRPGGSIPDIQDEQAFPSLG